MNEYKLDELLQQCLEAYDAGMAPEECLSAFPDQRAELEPVFRQALALRISFARLPSPEFRRRAKERLMFAAGRSVRQAYDTSPDPAFVQRARERLLHTAGAGAQEALRSVPPPRLPFWLNARRRLLESASHPARRPVLRPSVLAMRLAPLAAVFVAALALAAAALFAPQRHAATVDEAYAALEQDWQKIELQSQSGTIPIAQIIEVTRRTNELVKKLDETSAPPPVVEKVQDLVSRQADFVEQAAATGAPPAQIEQAKAQVDEADKQVKILASRADSTSVSQAAGAQATDTPAPTATATEPAATASGQPAAGTGQPATNTPAASQTPQATATQEPLSPGQVVIALVPDDNTYNLSWKQLRTSDISLVVPSGWTIDGLSTGARGLLTLANTHLIMHSDDLVVYVNTKTGESEAIVDGKTLVLRGEGENADIIGVADLLAGAGSHALELRHFIDSIELTAATAPDPTSTATPTPTVTPAPSATPRPTSSSGR